MEHQILKLPGECDRSSVGLITVLKCPAMMMFVELHSNENRLKKKDGSLFRLE